MFHLETPWYWLVLSATRGVEQQKRPFPPDQVGRALNSSNPSPWNKNG
jgi:hypothetical protein